MFGREFQVVGAVQRKARPENTVLWNGTDSSGTVEERKVAQPTKAAQPVMQVQIPLSTHNRVLAYWRGYLMMSSSRSRT